MSTNGILKNHQATTKTIDFLNSLHFKKAEFFAQAFHPSENWPFRDILPGAKHLTDSKKLIAMHDSWFANASCQFNPLVDGQIRNEPFRFDFFRYSSLLAEDLYQSGIDVHVIKEKNLGEGKDDIVSALVHLQIILKRDPDDSKWWPIFIQNTMLET